MVGFVKLVALDILGSHYCHPYRQPMRLFDVQIIMLVLVLVVGLAIVLDIIFVPAHVALVVFSGFDWGYL